VAAALVLVPLATAVLAWWLVGAGGGLCVLLVAALPIAHWVRGRSLVFLARTSPALGSKRGVLVLSDSPVWRPYIEREWLPRLSAHLAVINWSERAAWEETVPVRLWRHFCGHAKGGSGFHREFNPAVILLRGLRAPLVYRFYLGFRRAQRGDPEGLARLEEHLFRELGLAPPSAARPRGTP